MVNTSVYSNQKYLKTFFYQPSQPPYEPRRKNIEKLVFVQGVKIDLTDLLKNNETESLLIFDDSIQKA